MIQDYLLETASYQQIKSFTRSEMTRAGLSRSCLDHCYSDVPEKLSTPVIVSAGDSDHLAVIITKYAKAPICKPQTTRKRNFKNFCIESFLTDVYNSDINQRVTERDNMEEAAKVFERKFSEILDFHAPMKTYQMRKHYLPHISEETKLLIKERKTLHEEAVRTGNTILLKEFKNKSKEVKKAIKDDLKEYHDGQMGDDSSISKAWKTAKDIL